MRKTWSGKFGREYTNRNLAPANKVNHLYIDNYGVSRETLNKEFLKNRVEKSDRILEVGCNIGNQLLLLQKAGYRDLWGIDLQDYAIEIAKKKTKGINIIKASANDVPFKNDYFDLVFTSGLLIHISPKNIKKALDEIYRCTNSYIWGLEYYLQKGYRMVNYRGENNLLWKTNFPKLFLGQFPNLELIHKKILNYNDNDNQDIMYLLKKNRKGG